MESGSGDDRSKGSGRSVKREASIGARVKRHLYSVERPKRGVFTGNVGRNVVREAQWRHCGRCKSMADTEVVSIDLDMVTTSSSEPCSRKLSRAKQLSKS